MDENTAYLLKFEIASKDKLLAEYEEEKNKQDSIISKLKQDLKCLSEYIQQELDMYNKSIVAMRNEILRFKKENKELRDLVQMTQEEKNFKRKERLTNDTKYLLTAKFENDMIKSFSENAGEAKVLGDISNISFDTQMLFNKDCLDSDRLNEIETLKLTLLSMKSKYDKDREQILEENRSLKLMINGYSRGVTTKQPQILSKKIENEHDRLKGEMAKPCVKGYAKQGPTPQHEAHLESGFLSASRNSNKKEQGHIAIDKKISPMQVKVPMINTEAILRARDLQCQNQLFEGDQSKDSRPSEAGKSDSLFISQKMSEDMALPFTDEESVDDRYCKQVMACEFMKTMPAAL